MALKKSYILDQIGPYLKKAGFNPPFQIIKIAYHRPQIFKIVLSGNETEEEISNILAEKIGEFNIIDENQGIGSYEYWGATGIDTNWQPTCEDKIYLDISNAQNIELPSEVPGNSNYEGHGEDKNAIVKLQFDGYKNIENKIFAIYSIDEIES